MAANNAPELKTLGRYNIERVLGKGAMGVVYEGVDPRLGRRVAITGPLESADVAGLATMYHFGRSLMPDLDRAPEPAEAVASLVAGGANGLANKRGVHDWTKRDGDKLLEARMAELFRWLKQDRERSR